MGNLRLSDLIVGIGYLFMLLLLMWAISINSDRIGKLEQFEKIITTSLDDSVYEYDDKLRMMLRRAVEFHDSLQKLEDEHGT